MALTGQAKTDYQREYMRRRRFRQAVRPTAVRPVRPVAGELSKTRQTGKGFYDE